MISKLHYITQGATPEEHLKNLQQACVAGADWIQLRLKNVPEEVVLATAEKARELTHHFQTRLIINDHYQIAAKVKTDGVHVGKEDAAIEEVRAALLSWQVIGGTANTLEDCENLVDQSVDYIGLGPFRFTETKKNLSPILGVDGYRSIIEELDADIPVIAIGGIVLDDVSELMETGIHGLAMSGEITNDFNKIGILNRLLEGPVTLEQKWTMPEQE